MESEFGDPFDGASPGATHLEEFNFDDLLGTQVPVEDLNVSMLGFQEEHVQTLYTPPVANMIANPETLPIKKEPLDRPFTLGTPMNTIDNPVEISDTEEADSVFKNGTIMSDNVIDLSDGEDVEEIIVYDDGSTSVAIKKENPDVEFLGATKGLVEVSDSENDGPSAAAVLRLGKSFLPTPNPRLKHTAAQVEKLRQMQRLYAERALAARKAPQGSSLESPIQPSDHDFAWMNGTAVMNDDPATNFSEVKNAYKAKRKARKNTLEDDVEFKRAQNEENQRLKRLAREAADTDSDDEAEESDDGLFVSQGPSSLPKRPFSSMLDMIDDDDDDDEVVPVEGSLSKKQKPAKPDSSTKKSRAKALLKELRCNMLAGIEASILKDQKRIEDKAAKAADAEAGNGGKRASRKSRKAKAPDLSAKRTATGRMNNIGSLVTSNIYEDSNANLDRQALPVITEKKKKEFMSSLIANIPLEDFKQANNDRIDILKASRLLGSRKVIPDGEGNWKLKGLKSSLYHYQVQGAACARMREIGEQPPYGGILADAMGLGKTVEMIATMLANRQTDPEGPTCTLIVCSPALMGQCEF